MPAINVRVDQELWSGLRAQKPHFLSDTAYLNLVISQAIDTTNTLGKPLAKLAERGVLPSLNKEEERAREELINRPPSPVQTKPKDPWSIKAVNPDLVPEDLTAVAEEFVEWWSVRSKGAVRSQKVADREFRKLLTYSASDRSKALQKAIAGGWKQLYEAKDLAPTQGRYSPAEPDVKHPAFKDARDIIKERGPEWDIPSVTGGRGVLEPGAF
jgi:hypothetical protein